MHGGFVPEGVGSMPGPEATAAAALLFWALVTRELFWRGFFGLSGVQRFDLSRMGSLLLLPPV